MTGPHHRWFIASFVAAVAGALCWSLIPGTELDRWAFDRVARGFANPPFFIAGAGSHQDPWKLRTSDTNRKTDKLHAPLVVSLDDDLEGFFQSSPPSPVDLAVIFKNLQRLGVNRVSSGAVLAWSDPDPIGLTALDKVISGFDSLVMAAPLSRGAAPESMPQAFRNASLPITAVQGDTSLLPSVNRIPIPGVILGGENTMAGFQALETEKTAERPPLLARWEDRVVFAFPVIAVMRHLGLPLDGVEIHPGRSLKLGPQGPMVPIDRFGRLNVPIQPVSAFAEIRAESLIDAEPGLFPETARSPIVLRDDRSESEPATQAFSRHLPAMISAISSDAGLSKTRVFPRVGVPWEVFQLTLAAAMALMTCGMSPFTRNIVFLLWASLAIAAQFLAAGFVQAWLPGLPCLAALATSWAIGYPSTAVAAPSNPLPPTPTAVPVEAPTPSAPIGDPILVEPENPPSPPTVAEQTPPEPAPKSAAKDKKSRKRKH